MSIAVMSDVWKNSKASHGALLVLLAIADFANDEGEAFPSIATLTKKARLSERAVQNAIGELGDLGELFVTAGAGRNGTNLYTVQILPPAEIAPPQKTTRPPAEIAPKPSLTVKGDGGAGEASAEPSIKSKVPTSPAAIRIAGMFNRKTSTEWMPKEIKQFKKLSPIDLDDLALLETYYAFERQKGGDGIHRRDLYTFLNNYYGELDRARAWRENPKANEKKPTNSNRQPLAASHSNAGTSNASAASQY